jgi:predicted MPP superfamily phosphohydrolase
MVRRDSRRFVTSLVLAVLAIAAAGAQELKLPNKPDSLKFAAIGDNGTGDREQYDLADLMAKYHDKFRFEHVIMLGDNMYGSQRPRDFESKFERPYKALLDRDVKFYAALGNHDNQENRFYKPWNMDGKRYYTYEKKNVRFFVLDTDYLDQPQREWIERELKSSNDDWKIVYFHHPLYSSGRRHGSELDLRTILEPLFVKYGVNVVFQGHDHIYERTKPQKGIYYFVEGASGKLRRGDLTRSSITAAGTDAEQSFMLIEVDGDEMYFQAVGLSGKIVDAGSIRRQERPKTAPTTAATQGRPAKR